jgi:hypothetical protein
MSRCIQAEQGHTGCTGAVCNAPVHGQHLLVCMLFKLTPACNAQCTVAYREPPAVLSRPGLAVTGAERVLRQPAREQQQHGTPGVVSAAAMCLAALLRRGQRLVCLGSYACMFLSPCCCCADAGGSERAPVFQFEPHFWLELEGVVLKDLLYQLICVRILCSETEGSGSVSMCRLAGTVRNKGAPE